MNQFKLTFSLEKPFLPKNLEPFMISFLKEATLNYSEEFHMSLYDKSKSIMKCYTFSYYLPNAKFQKERISLGMPCFEVFFSDADLVESIQMLNSFKTMYGKSYPMKCNSIKLVSIVAQKRKEIRDSEIVVKMLSSLIVRRHNSDDNSDIYYTYEDDGFGEVLRENVDFMLKKLDVPISTDGFSIVPIKGKKVVQCVFEHMIDANIGIYKVTGTPELLNFLYMAGLGCRRSEGHGKFEIVM